MIDVLTPLALLALIVVAMGAYLIVGHASVKLLVILANKFFGARVNLTMESGSAKLFIYIAVGVFLTIVYSLLLSLFILLNSLGVLLVIGLSVAAEVLIVLRRILVEKSLSLEVIVRRFRLILNNRNSNFLLVLFVVGVVWYFGPAIGLSSYPGGDDRGYLFITKEIIDKGTALTAIDYPYVSPYNEHLLNAAFMVLASFTYNLFQVVGLQVSLPLIDLTLSLLFFSLTSISVYLFTNAISGNRQYSMITAVTSLFLWRSLLLYFNWGGVGESMGYFLIPLFALVDYRLNNRILENRRGMRVLTGISLVKVGMLTFAAYTSVYSAFLFLFLVGVVTPLLSLSIYSVGERSGIREKVKLYLRLIAPYVTFVLGVVVLIAVSVMFLQLAGIQNMGIAWLYNLLIPRTEEMLNDPSYVNFTLQSLVFARSYGLADILGRLATVLYDFYGELIFVFLPLYVCLLAYRVILRKDFPCRDSKNVLALTNKMALAGLLLFLFSQNTPLGWYYFPYPFANSIALARLYYNVSLFLVYIESLPIFLLYLYLKDRTPKNGKKGKRVSVSQADNSRKQIEKKQKRAVGIAAGILVVIILLGVFDSYSQYWGYRTQSVVSPHDLDAFRWINANAPKNATFFVNTNDAGGYTYFYTGRTVIPPYAVRLLTKDNETSMVFTEIETMLQQGNITAHLIQVLSDYHVSFIYVGERTQYGFLGFNVTALILSPYFAIEFNEGGTYIFKTNST